MVMGKKKTTQKGKNMIFVLIVIAFLAGYFVAIHILPAFMIYTDGNTESYLGKVTSIEMISEYTGYKSRQRGIVYIEIDGEHTFHISNLTLRKRNIEYDSLKDTILNSTVEIRSAKSDDEKIVSIRKAQDSILTFDDVNKSSQSNRVGLALICLIIIIFIAVFWFI